MLDRRHLLLSGAALTLSACDAEQLTSKKPAERPNGSAEGSTEPTASELAIKPEPISPDEYPLTLERQRGDAELSLEGIWIDPAMVLSLAFQKNRASFAERIKHFDEKVLEVAERCIGFSRQTHPQEVERILQLYGLGLRYPNGAYVPYCAAGVSFCAAMAYLEQQGQVDELSVGGLRPLLSEIEHYHFYPSPSVVDIYYSAKGKRQWRDESKQVSPKPGWLVVYDFGVGRPSHVGILKSATASELTTIEFNTRNPNGTGSEANGGAVVQRNRERNKTVLGYVATTLNPPWQ